ncbi:hypothetical protein KNO15_20850 [Leifsonia shinshuensis]|uniref:hypothetical protein n=1 Tax=Leifsonia shinshuensis TaxID=150026 RepID=UPI001F50B12A|nr:hypothetical protein [Leifsonia shinshuensis]MCI0159159.1 hypothetical protein [Leifsonia shinshuensis]
MADVGVGMYAKYDGQLVDLRETFQEHSIDLDQPSTQTNPRARLIDFSQWVSCYTFGIRDEVFTMYTHYWDGVAHDVRLKCGEPGGGGWGYRHIEEGHRTHWQQKLDGARAKGWAAEAYGVHSWDDLMAGAVGSAVTWPEHIGGSFQSATKCGVTTLYLVDINRPQVVLMSFNVVAVWALNSDRLITAYPATKTSC